MLGERPDSANRDRTNCKNDRRTTLADKPAATWKFRCSTYAARVRRIQSMTMIRKTAVLGAGTMGAQIAAHLANAGLPVLLLDINRELAERGRQGLEKASPP